MQVNTTWEEKKAHGLIQANTMKNISVVCHPICEQRFISLWCFSFEFTMILQATVMVFILYGKLMQVSKPPDFT